MTVPHDELDSTRFPKEPSTIIQKDSKLHEYSINDGWDEYN